MDLTWFQRFGAVSGVVLGLSIGVPGAVEAFTGETSATSFALGLGVAFSAPAVTALYLHHRATAGRFGAVAYAVNLLGLGLFTGVAFALNLVLFYLDKSTVDSLLAGPTGSAVSISALVFVAGTVLFSVSMVRSGGFPKLPAVGYGVALTLLALLAPLPDSPATSVVHVVAAVSIGWLSLAVLPARRPVPVAA
ncbi:hypothetical protein ACFPIJ_31390 [Dactylosporangium cerinum]|uniref:Integral membrane protein n=1 Tax=Dactylosporangium cerinum TaxID=1434730 RepID=A0ABV9W0Z0_9ACTN